MASDFVTVVMLSIYTQTCTHQKIKKERKENKKVGLIRLFVLKVCSEGPSVFTHVFALFVFKLHCSQCSLSGLILPCVFFLMVTRFCSLVLVFCLSLLLLFIKICTWILFSVICEFLSVTKDQNN